MTQALIPAHFAEQPTDSPYGMRDPEPLAQARAAWIEATGADKAAARVVFLRARFRVVTERMGTYLCLIHLCRRDLAAIRAELPASEILAVEKQMAEDAQGKRPGKKPQAPDAGAVKEESHQC